MKCLVTGGAGFIGSNLSKRLLALGHDVIVYDNLSTGYRSFLPEDEHTNFKFVMGDLLDLKALSSVMKACDIVFHFAANADVRFGTQHPSKDIEQNTLATFHVLEAMRINDVKKIVFSSTGSIYGESKVFPTPENAPFPIQTSLYGASKLAGEGLIQAYCEGFNFQGWIFRFVSILGEGYTHGHVFDFYKSLQNNPNELYVLGNGLQKKSYLYIQDCIDAIFIALERAQNKINIFNLGTDEYCMVNDSIGWITSHLQVNPQLRYSGGERGWIGDNPFIFLDVSAIQKLGWNPKYSIREAVVKTLEFLKSNPELLKSR